MILQQLSFGGVRRISFCSRCKKPLSNPISVDDHFVVRTNVPHLVVHHSPTGFEFGYAGSGPADLALNVCQWYLESIHYRGEKTHCFNGNCWSLAWILHQEFKRVFIANAPRQGITIPMIEIKEWFEAHITEDMKRMYATTNENETE